MKKWKAHIYQLVALCFVLRNPKAGLFLDPGLGKTSITLAAIRILKFIGKTKGVLIVAPLRVCHSVWPGELKKWQHLQNINATVLHGDNKSAIWSKHDMYIINPEGLEWLHSELLEGLRAGKPCPFNMLVIDESTLFKTHDSNRFQYIVDMLPLFIRRVILTGSPTSNSLLSLWAQIYILDEGKALEPNYYHYRNKYFEANDWDKYNYQIKDFCEDIIYEKISHLVLQMDASDYLDMPEKLINPIPLELPKGARKLYNRMKQDYAIEKDLLTATASMAGDRYMKLHQIANGNVYEDVPLDLTPEEKSAFKKTRKTIYIHDTKLQCLQEIINELNGKPLLIGYHFNHDLTALKSLLGKDLKVIEGDNTTKIENAWNAGKIKFLAMQYSGSHGLNLQEGGHDIFEYSLTPNFEYNDQFIRRIWRQGVKGGEVRVHRPYIKNSIDEDIMSVLAVREQTHKNCKEALKV